MRRHLLRHHGENQGRPRCYCTGRRRCCSTWYDKSRNLLGPERPCIVSDIHEDLLTLAQRHASYLDALCIQHRRSQVLVEVGLGSGLSMMETDDKVLRSCAIPGGGGVQCAVCSAERLEGCEGMRMHSTGIRIRTRHDGESFSERGSLGLKMGGAGSEGVV